MAAYFQLFPKGEKEAATFVSIDEAMCKHFQAEVDPVKYYKGWYDNIGLFIAMGNDWGQIREIWKDFPDLLAVIDWLEANYTTDSWFSR